MTDWLDSGTLLLTNRESRPIEKLMQTLRALSASTLLSLAVSLASGCLGSVHEPEPFHLRPYVEKTYGYTHAIRIGDDIKISGAVSMDDEGQPTAVGDLEQQMRNCYADLRKVLEHYGCTFEDVVVENIFTTNMAEFLQQAAYRNEIYGERFPTGSWLEVKGLALPEFLIEIELEVHDPRL